MPVFLCFFLVKPTQTGFATYFIECGLSPGHGPLEVAKVAHIPQVYRDKALANILVHVYVSNMHKTNYFVLTFIFQELFSESLKYNIFS